MSESPPRRSDLDLPLPFDDLTNDGPLRFPSVPDDWHLGVAEDGTFSPVLLTRRRAEHRQATDDDASGDEAD